MHPTKKTAVLIISFLIVAVISALGAHLFYKNVNDSRMSAPTFSGAIIDISLDQVAFDGPALIKVSDARGEERTIALPSFGMPLCAARENIADFSMAEVGDTVEVAGSLDAEGRIVPCEDQAHYLTITGSIRDNAHGFKFDYRKGPDGYIVLPDEGSTDPDYVAGRTLFNREEYDNFQASADAREGPTSIQVRVYKNDDNLHAPVWAIRKPSESNIELALEEPRSAVVGGANASFYVVDGLYAIDTYVVASGGYIYLLTGSYLNTQDRIYEDFHALVSSFAFVPMSEGAP